MAGNANIGEEIRKINEKLEGYLNLEKQYHEKLQRLDKEHNGLVSQRALLTNQLEIYLESLKNEETKLQAALLGKGFEDLIEVESSVLLPEEQKVLSGEINVFDRTGISIRAQKEMTGKKLNFCNITEEEWNRKRQQSKDREGLSSK